MTVSSGATELYYMNYLYGFLSSAAVYSVLHCVLPDNKLSDFIHSGDSVKETQQLYHGRWDVTLAEAPDVLDRGFDGQTKGPKSAAASV